MCKDDRSVNYERPSTYSGSCNNWNNSETHSPRARLGPRSAAEPECFEAPQPSPCPCQPHTALPGPPSAPISIPHKQDGFIVVKVFGGRATTQSLSPSNGRNCHARICRAPKRSCALVHPTKPFIPAHSFGKHHTCPRAAWEIQILGQVRDATASQCSLSFNPQVPRWTHSSHHRGGTQWSCPAPHWVELA